ncbi:MAG: hypothetical protein AABZ12_01540 [Planctomycetota bacterium]
MSVALLGLFTSPLALNGPTRLVLMLPLCLSIAIVYKAMRLEDIAALPRAAFGLFVTIVVGMCAVGLGLWAVFSVLV